MADYLEGISKLWKASAAELPSINEVSDTCATWSLKAVDPVG